jgi:hypothetical protein
MINTVYNKICVMLPTLGRAYTKLITFVNSLLETAENIDDLCLCFIVNNSDKETEKKIVDLCDKKIAYEIIHEDTEECDLSYYFNLAYKKTKFNSPGTCVSMFGDDMVFVTKGWNTMMLKKMNDMHGIGIVYGDDDYCQHEYLCVYLITSRLFVELTEKSFMCEAFPIDFIDTVWMELARKLNCASYLPSLHIRHDHANRNGDPDEVWTRMRRQGDKSHDDLIFINDYTNEMAANVKRNLAEKYLSKDISFMMTTYNRISLLRQTVNSWNRSLLLPDKLFVFDDASEDFAGVSGEINRMRNAYLIPDKKHLGCNGRNVTAVKTFDTPAVMVIDSDTEFSPHWCIAASVAWNKIKKDTTVAGVTLFNTKEHPIMDSKGNECDIRCKASVGGFGTIFKLDTIKGSLAGTNDDMPAVWSWDNHVCDWVKSNGKKFCCTDKSYLQHIGFIEGTHTNDVDMGDYAPDFVAVIEDHRKPKGEPVAAGEKVIFSAMARLGDVIASSMVANMIIDRGFKLSFIVIKKYESLASRICPDADIISVEPVYGGPKGDWSETTTERMKAKYPGYSVYINAQIGSRENHNYYTTSGKHPCFWISNLCSRSLGITLGENFKDYLRFNSSGITISERDVKIPENLAVISTIAKTSISIIGDMPGKIFSSLKAEGYSPRFLVEERPQGLSIRQFREEYISGLSIEQCILLIMKAKHYVGQDSGMSWCSLFSPCSKQIYHLRQRIEMVNTYFKMIDDKAEDIILDGR